MNTSPREFALRFFTTYKMNGYTNPAQDAVARTWMKTIVAMRKLDAPHRTN